MTIYVTFQDNSVYSTAYKLETIAMFVKVSAMIPNHIKLIEIK